MRLSFLITVSFISCVLARSTDQSTISAVQKLDDGDLVIYEKTNGTVASLSPLRDVNGHNDGFVTKITDGRNILIKNAYNFVGRMLDCDISLKPEEARSVMDKVDQEIKRGRIENFNYGTLIDSIPDIVVDDLRKDIDFQVNRCENLLAMSAAYRNVPKRDTKPTEIEIEDNADVETKEKQRRKRAYLIWPGTNWCGKGSKAEFAQSYGEHAETDQCCQKHDQCPYIIEGFTTRYNLFNYRIHTLSACDCDQQFLDCLKSANTSTSAMVGKVYFNVVNAECFDLKLQKTCAKRSWWGGCEKYTTKWAATIRSLGDFPE